MFDELARIARADERDKSAAEKSLRHAIDNPRPPDPAAIIAVSGQIAKLDPYYGRGRIPHVLAEAFRAGAFSGARWSSLRITLHQYPDHSGLECWIKTEGLATGLLKNGDSFEDACTAIADALRSEADAIASKAKGPGAPVNEISRPTRRQVESDLAAALEQYAPLRDVIPQDRAAYDDWQHRGQAIQRNVMRIYRAAAAEDILPRWVDVPQDESLVFKSWMALSNEAHARFPHETICPNNIGRGYNAIRGVYEHGPEDCPKFVEQAEKLITLLIKLARGTMLSVAEMADAATKETPTNSDEVWLTTIEREVLVAMLGLKAFDSDSRQTAKEIAIAASGKFADPENYKVPLRALKGKELVETLSRGPASGSWLTPAGRIRASKLAEQ